MAYFTPSFLLFSCLMLQCLASPARVLRRQDPVSTSISSASSLVITATDNANALVTFYPTQITDLALWTLPTPTTISSTEVVYPGGYEWVPSPVPAFQAPAIPTDAPYPIPPASSSSSPAASSAASSAPVSSGSSDASSVTATGASSSGSAAAPSATGGNSLSASETTSTNGSAGKAGTTGASASGSNPGSVASATGYISSSASIAGISPASDSGPLSATASVTNSNSASISGSSGSAPVVGGGTISGNVAASSVSVQGNASITGSDSVSASGVSGSASVTDSGSMFGSSTSESIATNASGSTSGHSLYGNGSSTASGSLSGSAPSGSVTITGTGSAFGSGVFGSASITNSGSVSETGISASGSVTGNSTTGSFAVTAIPSTTVSSPVSGCIPRPLSALSEASSNSGASSGSSSSVGESINYCPVSVSTSGISSASGIVSGSSTPSSSASSGSSSVSQTASPASTTSAASSTASSAAASESSAAFSGSFTATPTQQTEALPIYTAPTSTIAAAAATSDAAVLGGLFFALKGNRDWIRDPKLKSQYIDDIQKTKDQTFALFADLAVQPPADPACSNTKRKRSVSEKYTDRFGRSRNAIGKRSLISGLTDLVGDVGKLLACATKVVDNLVTVVKLPVAPLAEIETLTDTLAEIADNLKQEENDPSKSATQSQPSKTSSTEQSSTITSSASASSASSSASSSSASSSSSGGFVCATACASCSNDNKRKNRRGALANGPVNEPLDKRTLPDPDWADSRNAYVMEQIESKEPGGSEVMHRQTGMLSSAVVSDWVDSPQRIWLTGLFGCTSVIIISEAGVWISHLWEAPSFLSADTMFAQQVVGAIMNGDGVNMPSPFPLGAAGQILASGSKPQIFISTPNNPNGAGLLFQDRVNTVIQTLTGAGAPFAGVTVTTRGYAKPMSDTAATALKYLARGKILIQYDNNQVDDEEAPPCQQQAIWRVWLEDQMYQQEWDATEAQIGTGNHKRQVASEACTRPASSGVSTRTAASASGSLIASASSGSVSNSTSSSSVGPSSNSAGSLTSSISSSSTSTSSSPGALTTPSSVSASAISSQGSSSALPASTPSISASIPSTITSSTSSQAPMSTYQCYPFQDPDAGPAAPQCQCDGLPGKYPYLPSTSGQSNYDPCGYTKSPTTATATSVPAFTTTESDGLVISCASSTYFNYAVNHIPTCAGATQVIATVTSPASAYSVSQSFVAAIESASSASAASAASASASYASAAAVPSAGCWILSDDGWGDSAFEIYGINGWAGSDGSKLFDELFGCGIISGGEFFTDGQDDFEGQKRSTQYAYFGLSFFKGGCVERAAHSAGGPEPGDGPGQLACQHLPSGKLSDDQVKATGTIGGAQVKAVQNVANGGSASGSASGSLGGVHRLAVDNSGTASKPVAGGTPDPALVASASAALPHLLAAASATPSA